MCSCFQTSSSPYWMILGVGVSRVGSDNVADPSQRSTSANPETGRDDKPEYAREDSTVIELPDTGNKKTQESSCQWIAHYAMTSSAKIRRGSGLCSIEVLT